MQLPAVCQESAATAMLLRCTRWAVPAVHRLQPMTDIIVGANHEC